MTESQQLLAEYIESGSDAAFRELVSRYVDLVYSTALRLVEGDTHRAEDVAQTVFVDLARTARALPNDVMLGGWLHRNTCFSAAKTMRGERRRQSRERQAVEMNVLQQQSEVNFSQVAPILDEAINELGEPDRKAILLRFFEQQDFRKIGEAIGSNEDAARMRVGRALEKLELLLKRRGVASTTAALSVVLSANAVQAAPVGLAIAISTATALAGTTIATPAIATATKAIAMTMLQKTIIGAALAAAVGTGLFEARRAAQWRKQNQTLQQQQTALAEQIQQLTRERDDASRQLAVLDRNTSELLKLRGEVARLRADARELAQLKSADTHTDKDPMESAAKTLLGKINLLKKQAEQMPDKNIPELQYLDPDTWARIAQTASLDTDEGVRQAMSVLRDIAKQNFAPQIGKALQKYVQATNGELPTDVSQLKPHFESMVDDATLARYQVMRTGNIGDLEADEMIIAEKAPVDDDYDQLFQIGLNSRRSHGVGKNAGSSGSGYWRPSAPQAPAVAK